MQLQTKQKIIFALVRKNGQTFSELLENAYPKTNHESLSRGLEGLTEDNLIKKDNKLYYFSTEIKNPILLSLKGSYTIAKTLEGFLEKIKKIENPFSLSRDMIYRIMGLQIMLKLERYSTPKLTKREKLEFDLFADIFDAVTELIFKILRKDPKQTINLKKSMFKELFDFDINEIIKNLPKNYSKPN